MTWAAQPALMAALQEQLRQRNPQGDETELYRAVEVRGLARSRSSRSDASHLDWPQAHVPRGRVLQGYWETATEDYTRDPARFTRSVRHVTL